MGTNYYARIIPTKERKKKLIESIEKDNFDSAMELARELYGDSDSSEVRGVIHLGKRSGGWKFLWNPNVREVYDGYRNHHTGEWVDKVTYRYLYPLTKEGITAFVNRPDVEIVSEYYSDNEPCNDPEDDKPTAEQFLDMAFNWGAKDGYDAKTYYEEHPGNVYCSKEMEDKWRRIGYETNYGHDFYSDGLRFSTSIEFS